MSRYATALCEECFKKQKVIDKEYELPEIFEEYIDELGNECYRTIDGICFSCILL